MIASGKLNPGSQTAKVFGPSKIIEGTLPPVTYMAAVMEVLREMLMENVVSIAWIRFVCVPHVFLSTLDIVLGSS